MKKILLIALAGALTGAAHASFTVATFADPTKQSSEFLFTFDMNANTLSGSWTGNGLTMLTPGFTSGGQSTDVRFEMAPVQLTAVIPNLLYTMGAGAVNFYTTDPNSPIFTITFDGGTFLNPFNAGASELSGNNITFAGPDVPTGLSEEQFSFSFANPVASGNVITYTGSFTSSAVPEPASMLALGAGIAMIASRRRAR
ncbi:MAG: PEP-CTERM sorting domain-containing protein [Fimbriimonadaceae bacterium]|nr:PEP-CTERM sorting domain-containing protein [Fimbriimonadaceae bacterium]QYK55704.1 MAG: PEP-CTERM sorting domain-containing protein [Fimbriimonadaceae bacterium]